MDVAKKTVLILIMLILTCHASAVTETPDQQQMFNFTANAAVPDFLQNVHVAEVNGKTIVLGGIAKPNIPNQTIYQLDQESGKWSEVGNLSFSLLEGDALSWDDRIICIDSLSGKAVQLTVSGEGVTEKQLASLDQPLKNQ